MMSKFPFLFAILWLSLTSCSSGAHKEENTSADTASASVQQQSLPKLHLPAGKIIDTVACRNDNTLHYTVYLPSSYNENKQWPVMYCFDPHGQARLPLSRYRQLAETYGFVMIGLYNSENGMDFNLVNQNFLKLQEETSQAFNLDISRIYTCGFSGGAKVAGFIAGTDGGIIGVIACSAGLPDFKQQVRYRFDYCGIAGKKDFNYTALLQQDAILEKYQFRHQFLSFDGKHEWPPLDVMQQAFEWLQLNAMRLKSLPLNDSMISALREKLAKEIAMDQAKGDAYRQWLDSRKMIGYLQGLSDIKRYESMSDSLGDAAVVKSAMAEQSALISEEQQLQQQYLGAMDQSNAWWQSEINKLHTLISQNKGSERAFMYRRTLSFMSLAFFMKANDALNRNELAAADHCISVFGMLDPENPDFYYLIASLDMKQSNKQGAITALRQAVKLGFSDFKRFSQEPGFEALKTDPAYASIAEAIQKNIK